MRFLKVVGEFFSFLWVLSPGTIIAVIILMAFYVGQVTQIYQAGQQTRALQTDVMTWINAGQPIESSELSSGTYTVVVPTNGTNRSALVRQSIPTGDIIWFVSEIPCGRYEPNVPFRKT